VCLIAVPDSIAPAKNSMNALRFLPAGHSSALMSFILLASAVRGWVNSTSPRDSESVFSEVLPPRLVSSLVDSYPDDPNL
jgi:hypothetical protein